MHWGERIFWVVWWAVALYVCVLLAKAVWRIWVGGV